MNQFIEALSSATSISEAKQVLKDASAFISESQKMGIEKEHQRAVNTMRKEANAKAISILDRVGSDHTLLTVEDIAHLKAYSGIGGTDTKSDTGGHIHEYYTPKEIAEGVWDGLIAMGFENGNTLEPSAGAGVFQETKPKGVVMTATEIDPTSSKVNQLLHPDDLVMNQSFEELAANAEDGQFDSCIGNVPFGKDLKADISKDPDYTARTISDIDGYFVVRTIDKVKAGGLIGLVVPTRIISGEDTKLRRLISEKAEFLGAHRLPSGTFSNSGTDVVTDIIFLQKHSEELADIITKSKVATLKKTNVLWDTFIQGRWFESSEGKKFVHGESSISKFQNRLVVSNKNALTNAALKERLSHKFESRIDYDELNAAETIQVTYSEGDEKLINGRWMKFVGGEWELIKLTDESGKLDAEKYGASTVEQLERMLAQPSGALRLTFSQLTNVHKDFPYITKGAITDFFKLAGTLDKKYHEQVIRGSIIGMQIQALQAADKADDASRSQAQNVVKAEFERFGPPAGKISVLSGRGANYWNAFATSFDKDGKQSDLLIGTLVKGEVIAFDSNDIAQTVGHLFSVKNLTPVSFEDFLETYTGEPLSLEQLAAMNIVAITVDGSLAPLDRATTGNIVQTRLELLQAIGNETNSAIAENYQLQLELIEKKRTRTEIDNIEITMAGKWLPRAYVTEFLRDTGYSDIEYSRTATDENGELYEDTEYEGEGGIYSGYTTRNGKKRSSSGIEFERQLENYLNNVPVRSSDNNHASLYKDRIKGIERDFAVWIRQHDDIEKIANLYNDTFNGYIPIEHSGQPLNLTNTSGQIVNFDYQCSEIRRLSELGTGICGFGTGLGKTATALGLVAYNTQLGRASRTALVVPKSVIENWYHETTAFFGRENSANTLFIDYEPVRNKETGEIEQVTVLDEKGKPKRNSVTGDIIMRDKLKELSSKERKKRLNLIPNSNYTLVVMTKERYKDIPLRPESVGAFVSKMVDQGMLGGKYVAEAQKHREAMKNERFKSKFSDTGGEKDNDIPYFESMGFDNVIVDEGHNYRNSYKAGMESSKIAYLPTQGSSQVAIDMALKGQFIKDKRDGRGVVMLSATPTVNSPTDIFNMLSHTMTPEEWGQLGITDVDDFIRVFGETEEVPVQKLSGETEVKTALVGFKNLSGLRSLFHKHVNLKSAKDVSSTVIVPPIEDVEQECEMSAEQKIIYEDLRVRAAELNNLTAEQIREKQDAGEDIDSVFGLLRDMDRVTTDIDLYNREMTFVIPLKFADNVNKLVDDLPAKITVTVKDADKDDESAEKSKIDFAHNAKITTQEQSVTLVVTDKFEDEVVKRFSKFGIDAKAVSHPITPKYARMLEVLKAGLEDGKQIIFTEEKTQHNKVKRIIANHLGIDEKTIGIINADTTSGTDADKQQASLEGLATKFNQGEFQILICNKKAEVGVNLHHGTSDVLHLTLPWVPSSLKQRNGRASRVGSTMGKVRAHYFVGKGSFDEFRLDALKRKAQWMDELFTSDADRIRNADADDAAENSLLLAASEEERAAIQKANEKKAIDKKRKLQATRAAIDLSNYIKASHDLKADSQQVRDEATAKTKEVQDLESEIAKTADSIEYWRKEENGPLGSNYDTQKRRNYQSTHTDLVKQLAKAKKEALAASKRVERITKAESQVARLRGTLAQAIKDGVVDATEKVLDHGDKFLVVDGKTIEVGKIYNGTIPPAYRGDSSKPVMYEVNSLNFDYKTANVTVVFSTQSYGDNKLGNTLDISATSLQSESTYSKSEITLRQTMTQKVKIAAVANLLTKEQFYHYLQNDTLTVSFSTESGSGGSAHILHSGNSFEIISGYKTIEESRLKDLVYPSQDDSNLKKRLAKWLLDDRAARLDAFDSPKGYLVAIFGEQFERVIESHGKQATTAQITAWGSKVLQEFIDSEKGKEAIEEAIRKNFVYSYYAKDYAKDHYPIEFDNHNHFKDHLAVVEEQYTTHVKALIDAEHAKTAKLIQTAYKMALTSPPKAQQERATFIYDSKNAGESFDTAFKRVKEKTDLFSEDKDILIGQCLAALELLLEVDAGVGSLAHGEFTARIRDMYNNTLVAHNDVSQKALGREVVETIVEKSSREDANSEYEAIADAITKTVVIDSITFKPNSCPITIKKNRFTKAVTYDVGEVIGINDTKAYDGYLYKNKDALKDLHPSVSFSNDKRGKTEFNGAWWFIAASATTLTELKETLGIE